MDLDGRKCKCYGAIFSGKTRLRNDMHTTVAFPKASIERSLG